MGIAFETFHQNQDCILFSPRLSDPDEQAILIEEAYLCVRSCLRILKSVTESRSSFYVVLECLKNIETCASFLRDRVMLDKENEKPMEKMKQMVVESSQVSIKWCKKYQYNHNFPCYLMDEAEKELQVCINAASKQYCL